jgi:hypothetical protein
MKTSRRQYATSKDGVNYRAIADQMTVNGHTMNHSSARNYVLRAMRKFAIALNSHFQLDLTEDKLDAIANSSNFQASISNILKDLFDDTHSNKT